MSFKKTSNWKKWIQLTSLRVHIFSSMPNSIGVISEYTITLKICIELKTASEKTTKDQISLSQIFRPLSTRKWSPWTSDFSTILMKYRKVRWPILWFSIFDVTAISNAWTLTRRRSAIFSTKSLIKWNSTSLTETTEIPANNPISPPSAPRKSDMLKASSSING